MKTEPIMRTFFVLVAVLLFLTPACSRKPKTLEVTHAVLTTIPGGGMAAIYLEVTNGTEEKDRLVSVTTPLAEHSMLHETVEEGGVVKMVHLEGGYELPAGGVLKLEPGGKHVMLSGLSAALPKAKTAELTLTFEKAGTLKAEASVRSVAD